MALGIPGAVVASNNWLSESRRYTAWISAVNGWNAQVGGLVASSTWVNLLRFVIVVAVASLSSIGLGCEPAVLHFAVVALRSEFKGAGLLPSTPPLLDQRFCNNNFYF